MHILEWENTKSIPQFVIICCDDEGRKTHRCGYIGVPPGHFLHGIAENENVAKLKELSLRATLGQKSPVFALIAGVGAPEGSSIRHSPDVVFDCHGGITYSGNGYFLPKGSAFEHYWFFGFDCRHCEDDEIEPAENYRSDLEAKSLDFCIEQCESLAQQIAVVN